jgi:hypothetical protein
MMLLVLLEVPQASKLEQLVWEVLHPMNHHLTQLVLMPRDLDLVLVMALLALVMLVLPELASVVLVLPELASVLLVQMNHHHPAQQQKQHLVVVYLKLDFKLLHTKVK